MKTLMLIHAALIIMIVANGQQKNWPPEEAIIGNTYYDLQTTRSMQNRIFYFDDGSIGAVWNMGMNYPGFNDLGIGYNYFDGNSWGLSPNQSITSGRSCNPSYTAFGENGEIVVSESDSGLYINYRDIKGTGSWQEDILPGPPGNERLFSPQILTTGINNTTIHLLALQKDTTYNFQYQDNVGKILYARSSNGGATWTIIYFELDNLNQDYFGFSELSVVWAEPKNNTLAFVAGDYLTDLILMKSNDGGYSWQKIVIWEHPYPFFELHGIVSDTFWANTGSQSVAIDNDQNVHVAFALTQIYSDTTNPSEDFYNPKADGIAYWKEGMPAFSNSVNSLNPDTLLLSGNLIGWTQDINFNGYIDFMNYPNSWFTKYPSLGISTIPTLTIEQNNNIILIYSSTTETYDNSSQFYKHLWGRISPNNGSIWGSFADLTGELIHIFDECVFPVSAGFKEGNMHLIFQQDNEPGMAVTGDNDPYGDNLIKYMKFEIYFEPMAEFYALNSTINEGDSAIFINQSTQGGTYTWHFEGGYPDLYVGYTPPPIFYYEEGLYDVFLQVDLNGSGASEFKDNYITVLLTQISESATENQISLFPNPFKDKITISVEINKTSSFKMIIYNTNGTAVKMFTNEIKTPGTFTLSWDGKSDNGKKLPSGIYFCKVQTKELNEMRKIIIY